MVVKVKHESDVHIIINVQQPSSALGTPLVLLLTKGTKSGVYGNADTLAEDYDETTNVYKQAAAMWRVASYTAPIAVVACPDEVRHTPGHLTVAKDGTVTATDTVEPGIVTGIKTHLYDGAIYALLDDVFTLDEIEQLSDFLYDQQRLMLVAQVRTTADLQSLQAHVAGYQTAKSVMTNTAGFQIEEGNFALDNATAYAATNWPVDWQHIGGKALPDIVPDSELTMDDYDDIAALRGLTVVNKSGDNMILQGKALANNYIDQFVHVNLVGDGIENGVQKKLNHTDFPNYNDDTIQDIEQTILAITDDYATKGVLDKLDDGKSAHITIPKRANVSQSDVTNRRLRGIIVDVKVADDVESVELTLNVTL